MKIGGNTKAVIQLSVGGKDNGLGQIIPRWINVKTVMGWLDLQAGQSDFVKMQAKLQESTHVFIADFFPLTHGGAEIQPENSRMVINDKNYEVLLFDNPMQMNSQIEVYLKYRGDQ